MWFQSFSLELCPFSMQIVATRRGKTAPVPAVKHRLRGMDIVFHILPPFVEDLRMIQENVIIQDIMKYICIYYL